MLERILIKSALIRIDAVWEKARYKVTPDHYTALASVWSEWRFRLSGSWVQTIIKRELRRISEPFSLIFLYQSYLLGLVIFNTDFARVASASWHELWQCQEF